MKRLNLLGPVVGAVGGAIGGLLAAAWYVGSRVSPHTQPTYMDGYTFTPWELGIPYETVRFTSADGLSLAGWWMPRENARGVVIGCHGHTGSKDELLGIGSATWRAGYSVLVFDFRGRGESDPWPRTLVSREVEDLLAAVALVRSREPDARLGVIGFSMGASVALLAAAQEPTISAVVADSAFASGADVVAENIRRQFRIPPEMLVAAADEIIHRSQGYRFSQARPIDAISKIAPRPLLMFHGAEDTLTDVSHAERLYAAAGQPKQLVVTPAVEHCGSYFADRRTYCAQVVAFWDQYLGSI